MGMRLHYSDQNQIPAAIVSSATQMRVTDPKDGSFDLRLFHDTRNQAVYGGPNDFAAFIEFPVELTTMLVDALCRSHLRVHLQATLNALDLEDQAQEAENETLRNM
jgi:hypothetical protein